MFITPQERGFASDATHIRFAGLRRGEAARATELGPDRCDQQYSFPFPRFAGKVFTYNEFISVAGKR